MTGGSYKGAKLASTEILSMSISGSGGWKYVGELPSPRLYLKGITLKNKIIVTGFIRVQNVHKINFIILGGCIGYEKGVADILQFDPTSNQWVETGQMNKKNCAHSVSLIPLDEAKKLCA